MSLASAARALSQPYDLPLRRLMPLPVVLNGPVEPIALALHFRFCDRLIAQRGDCFRVLPGKPVASGLSLAMLQGNSNCNRQNKQTCNDGPVNLHLPFG